MVSNCQTDTDNLLEDEFVTSESLQKWIGLTYSITNGNALSILIQSITSDQQIGIGSLPLHIYNVYFHQPLQELVQNPLHELKSWLSCI